MFFYCIVEKDVNVWYGYTYLVDRQDEGSAVAHGCADVGVLPSHHVGLPQYADWSAEKRRSD